MNDHKFRIATERDAALVLEFIKGIAIYEDMLDEVINTEEQIREVVGNREVEIIDSGEAVERRVEQLLDEYGLRADADHRAEYRFLTFADEEYAARLERKAFER